MMTKRKIVAVSSLLTVAVTVLGTVAGSPAHADDSGSALYGGVNALRPTCGAIGNDARLASAAQRHANDMLKTGVASHAGSDGSSPRARIAEAGYARPGYTGEIVYWGTGSAATPAAALEWWMKSPPHRAIIVNCAFTTGGFATASNGNMMTAVGEFGGA